MVWCIIILEEACCSCVTALSCVVLRCESDRLDTLYKQTASQDLDLRHMIQQHMVQSQHPPVQYEPER